MHAARATYMAARLIERQHLLATPPTPILTPPPHTPPPTHAEYTARRTHRVAHRPPRARAHTSRPRPCATRPAAPHPHPPNAPRRDNNELRIATRAGAHTSRTQYRTMNIATASATKGIGLNHFSPAMRRPLGDKAAGAPAIVAKLGVASTESHAARDTVSRHRGNRPRRRQRSTARYACAPVPRGRRAKGKGDFPSPDMQTTAMSASLRSAVEHAPAHGFLNTNPLTSIFNSALSSRYRPCSRPCRNETCNVPLTAHG